MFKSVLHGLLDLVYPPQCLGCGRRTPEEPLCPQCVLGIERADPAAVQDRMAHLPAAQTAFDTALALWHFDTGGTLQRVQHAFKYQNCPYYGPPLGRLIGQAYQKAFPSLRPDLVVPVPLHRSRRLERGYNQSARLADGVADSLNVPASEGLLERPHSTRPQTRLSRSERWQNVSGAFHAPRPRALSGRSVLLVDDVLTTGATAAAAARELRRVDTAAVHLATLAIAQR